MPIQRNEIGVSTKPIAVTPSDTVNIATPARYLYVGFGGDINVTPEDGSEVIYRAVPTGAFLFVGTVRVNATDTNASNIIAHL